MEREKKKKTNIKFNMCEVSSLTNLSSPLETSKDPNFSSEYSHPHNHKINSKSHEGNQPGVSGKLNQVKQFSYLSIYELLLYALK